MVSLGSIFSSIWITVANSWQQTPAGHVMREKTINGRTFMRAEITDFWAMVFNPCPEQTQAAVADQLIVPGQEADEGSKVPPFKNKVPKQ